MWPASPVHVYAAAAAATAAALQAAQAADSSIAGTPFRKLAAAVAESSADNAAAQPKTTR
jgi:hypothetical protein